jgi:hypothetical protein
MEELKEKFETEIMESVRISKEELDYNPTRFIQMCYVYGVLEAAKKLLASEQVSDGFTTLTILGRRELTIESIARKSEFRSLFSDEELKNAANRLGEEIS